MVVGLCDRQPSQWWTAMNSDALSNRLLQLAVRIGKVVDALPETRLGRHIASQLVRCGTSPGPNYEEGCAAESKADFAHKLNISLKELRGTRYWIRLVIEAEMLPEGRLESLLDEADQLCRIIGSSVATARGRSKKPTYAPNPIEQ